MSDSFQVPKQMLTPKSLFIKERIDGYSNWLFASWRELFQNSVDAGAKNISINISFSNGKGVFNREENLEKVYRIVFNDDGKGMDIDTINNVFLKLGETSKKGTDSTGGFGTARNMLCFSNDRYSIRTKDIYVEGDGLEYNVYNIDELIANKEDLLIKAREDKNIKQIDLLSNSLIDLQSSKGFKKGCIFEIDINPADKVDYWNKISMDNLRESLYDYLSYSNLNCNVRINGEEYKSKHYKGSPKRILMFTDNNGNKSELGSIYVSSGNSSKHKGKVIVRVNGSAMFYEGTSAPQQVILEINKELSKAALNDTRDSLKGFVKQALNSFLEELVVNNESALKERDKTKHIEFKGGLGKKSNYTQQILEDLIQYDKDLDDGFVKLPNSTFSINSEFVQYGDQKISKDIFNTLVSKIINDEETILDQVSDKDELSKFKQMVKVDSNMDFLEQTSDTFKNDLVSLLVDRVKKNGFEDKGLILDTLKDFNDVHIFVDDLGKNDKVKSAVKRYQPDYWALKGDKNQGRGIEGHKLLTWFTTAVDQAVKILYERFPSHYSKKPLLYTTGFNFSDEKEVWNSLSGYHNKSNNALYIEKDGIHIFMINPITNDGNFAYDLKSEKTKGVNYKKYTLQDIEAFAIHEVSHAVSDRHDEEFANINTMIASKFDREKFLEEGLNRERVLDIAYGRSTSIIQELKVVANVIENSESKNIETEVKRRGRPPGSKNKKNSEALLELAVPSIYRIFEPENFEKDIVLENKLFDAISKSTENEIVTYSKGNDYLIINNINLHRLDDMSAITIVDDNNLLEKEEIIKENNKEITEKTIEENFDNIFEQFDLSTDIDKVVSFSIEENNNLDYDSLEKNGFSF
jgi:hypothetical protein